MRLNNKGFTLVELLTVMVILVTILMIAIPSITAAMSRSEDKQVAAKKESIKSIALIKLTKNDFKNTGFNDYRSGSCKVKVSTLVKIGYVSEEIGTKKKNTPIEGCIGFDSLDDYKKGNIKFYDSCSECDING